MKIRRLITVISLLPLVLLFQNCGDLSISNEFLKDNQSLNLESLSEDDQLEVQSSATKVWRSKLKVNFNSHPIGYYTGNMLKSDFGDHALRTNRGVTKTGTEPSTLSTPRVRIINGYGGTRSARFLLHKNQFGFHDSGASWAVPVPPGDRYRLKFKMRLSPNFSAKGGKIIGFRGGYEATGGRPATGTNGFSARINWWRRPNVDTLVSYVYHMNANQRAPYGDAFYWNCTDANRCSDGTIDLAKIAGKWQTVQLVVKNNTPGKKNGFVKATVNGAVLSHQKNLEFRTTNSLKIDKLYVNVFAGGSDSSYSPSEKMYIDMDSIEVFRWEDK